MRPFLTMNDNNIDPVCRWKGPIIDVHAHPRGLNGRDELNRNFIDELVEYSNSMGVIRMVTLGEVLYKRSGYTKEEIRRLNDRNAELTDTHPDFFIPFCFLDPTLGADFVTDESKRCYERYGFRALKLEVACNVSDPSTHAVFETAAENGFVLLAHATDTTVNSDPLQSDSSDLRKAVIDHPETSVIMAHLTAVGIRGVWEIADLSNVMVDTSGMQPDADLVEYAVHTLGANRVLYGSDMYARDLTAQIGQVLGSSIDDETKEKVFYTNSVRLFGIEGEKNAD